MSWPSTQGGWSSAGTMPAAVTTPSTQMLLGVQRQLDESFEHLVDWFDELVRTALAGC